MHTSNINLGQLVPARTSKFFGYWPDWASKQKILSDSLWTLISLSHNWNIKFAVAEYPLFSLFILGSHSLQNFCMAICILYLGGHIAGFTRFSLALLCWGSKVLFSPTLTEDFRGVDVKLPFWPLAKHTWQGCCELHVASSANLSLK